SRMSMPRAAPGPDSVVNRPTLTASAAWAAPADRLAAATAAVMKRKDACMIVPPVLLNIHACGLKVPDPAAQRAASHSTTASSNGRTAAALGLLTRLTRI